EPVPVVAKPEPEPTPLAATAEAPVSNILLRQLEDQAFAEAYLHCEACDSFGNTISGVNVRHSEQVTALGPSPQIERRLAPTSTSHMNPALLATSCITFGTDGEVCEHAGAANHPLNRGKLLEKPKRPEHPNATRQQMLNAILRDVSIGWSR